MKRMMQMLICIIPIWMVFCLLIGEGSVRAESGMPPGSDTTISPQLVGPIKVSPSQVFTHAEYQTGGTGLRNQRRGGILINGVTPGGLMTPTAAFIYWAYNSTVPGPVPAQSTIWVQRQWPLPATLNFAIPGILVGTGPDPCWAGGSINVYRGSIPLWTPLVNNPASGNGFYRVQIKAGSTGSTAGADPWVSSPPPNIEGASIVNIYPGTGIVSRYDGGLAGNTFGLIAGSGIAYSLLLPATTAGSSKVLWDTIGADGQSGLGRVDSATTSAEVTTIDGFLVSGPGAPDNDSDWNGNDSTPIPQLWDTQGHDITSSNNGDAILAVSITAPFDCLTPVANIVRQ